jgi:hypothetical protein
MKKFSANLKIARAILRTHGVPSNAKIVYSGVPFYFDFATDSLSGTINTLHHTIVIESI